MYSSLLLDAVENLASTKKQLAPRQRWGGIDGVVEFVRRQDFDLAGPLEHERRSVAASDVDTPCRGDRRCVDIDDNGNLHVATRSAFPC